MGQPRTGVPPRNAWSVVTIALAVMLAACGGGDTATQSADPATAAADPATTAADSTTTATELGTDDSEPTASDEEAQGEPIKIGVMNPFSGAFAIYGEQLFRGYELAAEEVNNAGGVLGRQIEFSRGDAISPDEGIAEATRLATQEDVDIFAGTYVSAVSNAASDVANQYGKLYWDTNALATELTERGLPNFVRAGPNAEDFAEMSAEVVIELISEQLAKDISELVVYLEHEESIYGTSIAAIQQELLEEAGATVAGVGAHNAGAADLTDSILRARDADPDVWVQTGYVPDGNLLLRTARDQGFEPDAMLLVGTGDTFETPEALGDEYLSGIMVVSYPWHPLPESFGPGSQEFLDAYIEKYGEEPIAAQAMTAYVGMKILLEVLEEAGSTDPESVREAAASFEAPRYSYANGFGVQFNESFQNELAVPAVIQWQDGDRVTVFPPEAAGENEVIDLSR